MPAGKPVSRVEDQLPLASFGAEMEGQPQAQRDRSTAGPPPDSARDGRLNGRSTRPDKARQTKYIFFTGGVSSSLGKGLTASSLGRLLKCRGLRVTMCKLDPYINVDPGTMNPFRARRGVRHRGRRRDRPRPRPL